MIMSLLQSLFEAIDSDKKNDILKCKIFECISILFVAIRKTPTFNVGEAIGILNALGGVANLDGGDGVNFEVKRYIYKTWVRMANAMGDQIAAFIPIIVPSLLKSLKQTIETGAGDETAADLFFGEEDEEAEEVSTKR